MEKSITRFQIIHTFFSSNRISLFGSLLEGNFEVGDFIVFEKDKEILKRKIVGLGTVSNMERKLIYNLRIKCKNKIEKKSLKDWNPNSVIANIITP